jgi:hypothetical protein
VVALFVFVENPSASIDVSSISDTAGLTWHKRKALDFFGPADSGNAFFDLEVWVAAAPSQLTSDAITINLSGTPDGAAVVACAVSGITNFTYPNYFDPNVSLPASASNGSTFNNMTVSVNTTDTNSLVFGFFATTGSAPNSPPTVGSGYTLIGSVNDHAPSVNNLILSLEYATFATAQSGLAVDWVGTGTNWGIIADAMVAGGSGVVLSPGAAALIGI